LQASTFLDGIATQPGERASLGESRYWMSFSMKRSDPVVLPLQPFAGAGGVAVAPHSARDPYEVLDDLMTVVEALCPQWPSRPTFSQKMELLL
jgi:hypothetical protein